MKFTLNNYHLSILQNKAKLYQLVNTSFNKSYFKLTKGKFVLTLRGDGALQTQLDIDYEGDDIYFSLDYSKWNTALQKFSGSNKINFEITDNTIKICTNTSDTSVKFGIITYDVDSPEVSVINDFILKKKEEVIDPVGNTIIFNEDIINKIRLSDSLFSTQYRINSIGIDTKDIIYSDRTTVLKSHLQEPLDKKLFKSLDKNRQHIYLHTLTIKLIQLLYKSNCTFSFNEDYSILYWEDTDTRILIVSESREVAIPTEEEWNSILPAKDASSFTVSLSSLQSNIDFFNGFYGKEEWKPIKFEIIANKGISLHYDNSLTTIDNTLEGAVCNTDGLFTISADTLYKIISRISENYEDDIEVTVIFDDDAPGIYFKIDDEYEFILSKLGD